jgi:hypothetical protein
MLGSGKIMALCSPIFFRHRIFTSYPTNVENMVSFNNAGKWQMVFNLAFKRSILFRKENTDYFSKLRKVFS